MVQIFRILHLDVRQDWDQSLMKIVFYLSFAQLAISIFSLGVNAKRHRRKSDRYSKSLITIIILTILILLFTFKNM
ncbi:MAG: hypothetical protein ACH0QD_11095 [Tepidibacillus sp.]|uniref:hypothetical protein n=1 Tax=Tepidibacillus sp. HK-1 TaxID=1883407 RepID=UPI0015ECA0A6|nr:hypothetical protein [Tepidibacillus sp. HK-1]